MSLLFCKISAQCPDGQILSLWEGGHPDEFDIRELLRYEKRYAPLRDAAASGAAIHVRHYRFRTKGRDWLAEQDHFALMDAYDQLAERCGEKWFLLSDQVEWLDEFTISPSESEGSHSS